MLCDLKRNTVCLPRMNAHAKHKTQRKSESYAHEENVRWCLDRAARFAQSKQFLSVFNRWCIDHLMSGQSQPTHNTTQHTIRSVRLLLLLIDHMTSHYLIIECERTGSFRRMFVVCIDDSFGRCQQLNIGCKTALYGRDLIRVNNLFARKSQLKTGHRFGD